MEDFQNDDPAAAGYDGDTRRRVRGSVRVPNFLGDNPAGVPGGPGSRFYDADGVAEKFGLSPGDSLVSSPETVFDIAGVYPLKLTNPDLDKTLRSRYQLFLDFNGFRKGYVKFATGETLRPMARSRP